MKKQIVYIHGGEAFSNYNDYLTMLKTTEVEDPFVDVEQPKKWKYTLKENLAATHDVAMPQMPSANNAKYEEWKIWFERHIPFIRDGVTLIGHSQGGYFLAKYLSENTFPRKIQALFLVAAPFGPEDFGGEDGGDFMFDPTNLPELDKQVEHIFIYHSKDDFVVPFTHGEKFHRALPTATFRIFDDRNHFLVESLPEIEEDIRSL